MTDWNKSWLTLRYRWKTVLGWSLAATLGLTTLVYADAHAPPTEADIPYMMQTLDDAAEGCRVFLNPAVPGGYMTDGVIEEAFELNGRWYLAQTHYCIEAAVLHVGSCYGPPWTWSLDWGGQGRVTLTSSSPNPHADGRYDLHSNGRDIIIHSQSTADDVTISLGPPGYSYDFSIFLNRGYVDRDIRLTVFVMHYEENHGSGRAYDVVYNPATETFSRISVISIPAPAPEMADVLRAPFREFFTRLHSIVETGEVPAVEPLDSCPAWW